MILSFAPLFFNRVWRCALILLIGAILSPGKRTVTSALRVMGLRDERRFQMYHRVLNRAVWSCRQASLILLRMLVATFASTGPLVLVLDDTIERRWGPQISARGIYRDNALSTLAPAVRSSDSHFVKTKCAFKFLRRWAEMAQPDAAGTRPMGRPRLGTPLPHRACPFEALLSGAQTSS